METVGQDVMDEWCNDFFESLHLHKKYVMEAGIMIGGIPRRMLFDHDASKFTFDEYPHYARQFHGDNGDPDGYVARDGSYTDGVMRMPTIYVAEMVADWMGASKAYTGSYDMTNWLKVNVPKIKLHNDSRADMFTVLKSLNYDPWEVS